MFCKVQETIDRLGAWLVICIEMHVLLSEWRNGTCVSPIDFAAMKRALLGCGFENLWECMCGQSVLSAGWMSFVGECFFLPD